MNASQFTVYCSCDDFFFLFNSRDIKSKRNINYRFNSTAATRHMHSYIIIQHLLRLYCMYIKQFETCSLLARARSPECRCIKRWLHHNRLVGRWWSSSYSYRYNTYTMLRQGVMALMRSPLSYAAIWSTTNEQLHFPSPPPPPRICGQHCAPLFGCCEAEQVGVRHRTFNNIGNKWTIKLRDYPQSIRMPHFGIYK